MIAVFLLAVLYEGLKTLREYLVYRDWKHWNDHKAKKYCPGNSLDSLDDDEDQVSNSHALIMSKKRRMQFGSVNRAPTKG